MVCETRNGVGDNNIGWKTRLYWHRIPYTWSKFSSSFALLCWFQVWLKSSPSIARLALCRGTAGAPEAKALSVAAWVNVPRQMGDILDLCRMDPHPVPVFETENHEISWMKYHEISWHIMRFDEISWDIWKDGKWSQRQHRWSSLTYWGVGTPRWEMATQSKRRPVNLQWL